MNIEYDRTIDDLIEFNMFHISHSPLIKRQLLIAQVIMAVLITIMILSLSYIVETRLTPIAYILGTLSGILVFIAYPDIYRASTIRRVRTLLNEGSNKSMLGRQIVYLSPEGIFCRTGAGESKINWSAIVKVIESDKYFFLYTGSINALLIPKGSLHTEKEQQDFLAYVEARRHENKV
jgi:YcxB-like protein